MPRRTPVVTLTISAMPDLLDLAAGFQRTLLAENKSPRTVRRYMDDVRFFDEYLAEQGMPRTVAHLAREHVEAHIAHLLEKWKPSTAATRFRGLQQFFKWCVEEGELRESPMVHAPTARPRGTAHFP